jgi:hypothetical protein
MDLRFNSLLLDLALNGATKRPASNPSFHESRHETDVEAVDEHFADMVEEPLKVASI